jgi:hypothetical protein
MTIEKQPHAALSHVNGAAWVSALLQAAPDAIDEAAATLEQHEDLSALGSSTLALVGNLVSSGIRKRILLQELEAMSWNLSRVAWRCRMSGPANVIRELRALGLGPLYEEMRSKGIVKHGRRRREPEVPAADR